MSNETTLANLRARALDYADMAGSDFPDTGRMVDYANDALSELHELLADQEYFYSRFSISLVAGTEEYDLPSDFYKSMRVWRLSSGRRYAVDRFNLSQASGYQTSGPSQADTVDLWYAPQLKRLTRESDRVEVALPNGWENYVALHMAVQLLNREESDSSLVAAERDRMLQRIMQRVEPRDQGLQDTVEDIYSRWSGGAADCEGRKLKYRIMGNKILFVEFDYRGV